MISQFTFGLGRLELEVFGANWQKQKEMKLWRKIDVKLEYSEPIWVTKFDHSISVTQFPSLITHHL